MADRNLVLLDNPRRKAAWT